MRRLMLTPTRNGLLVVFIEEYSKSGKGFTQTTDWGFDIEGDHTNSTEPRWAKVIAKGPDAAEEIVNGQYVLIEPLMWTPGFKHDDVNIWKTDSSKVLCTSINNPI